MKNTKIKGLKPKSIFFYGTVLISLVIIGYFFLNPKSDVNTTNSVQPPNTNISENTIEETTTQKAVSEENQLPESKDTVVSGTTIQIQEKENVDTEVNSSTANAKTQDKQTPKTEINTNETKKSTTQTKATDKNNTKQSEDNSVKQEESIIPSKAESTEPPIDAAIIILKNDVTSEAKFYPYELDSTKMEVIAVKASDGSIRTALNTCQICFDSGRGYYEQVGEFLVCQNCGNRFHIDQIEKIKGGCNPVPVLEGDKIDNGDFILISKGFMEGKLELFSNWQKNN